MPEDILARQEEFIEMKDVMKSMVQRQQLITKALIECLHKLHAEKVALAMLSASEDDPSPLR